MKVLKSLPTLALLVLLAACNVPPITLTPENVDKIHEGMSAEQVKAILGAPTDTKSEPIPIVGGTKTTYTYTHDGDEATIVLKNDTVQSKESHFATK